MTSLLQETVEKISGADDKKGKYKTNTKGQRQA
jgi:hypothetical protein